jgi:hypothetical protein
MFYGAENIDVFLLGYDIMQSSKWLVALRKNMLPASSTLTKEAACSSETFVTT